MIATIADPQSLRTTEYGPVVGFLARKKVHGWKGIPYAAPPVGAFRWRAPRPPSSWRAPLVATAYGHMAPQYAGLLAPVSKKLHGQIVGDEDCLTLNIFAPAWNQHDVPAAQKRRPVMVWIHGGGNAVGTAASYDSLMNYAADHQIIVVSINYRLGILGWFRIPGAETISAYSVEERSGNFGSLDIIYALKWIKANISVFGGSPDNVTIFGESAGGQHVLTLLVSPLAAGLFHRAIAQSPVADTYSMEEAINQNDSPLQSVGSSSAAIISTLAARSVQLTALLDGPEEPTKAERCLDYLRSLHATDLLTCFTPGSAGIYLSPRPIRDGVVLPLDPLSQVFASGNWNRVPVIIGNNRDEYRTFLADKPEYSKLLVGGIPLLTDREKYISESNFLSKLWRAVNVDEIITAMAVGGHTEAWSYQFNWDEAPKIPFIRPDILLGAAHGMEMAFVFGDKTGEFDVFKINSVFNKKSRHFVASEMSYSWVSFATDGHPSLLSGDTWFRYAQGPLKSATLIFDSEADGGIRMETLCITVDDLKQRLFTDKTQSVSQKCSLYARAFIWSPLFHRWGSANEYLAIKVGDQYLPPASQFRPRNEI